MSTLAEQRNELKAISSEIREELTHLKQVAQDRAPNPGFDQVMINPERRAALLDGTEKSLELLADAAMGVGANRLNLELTEDEANAVAAALNEQISRRLSAATLSIHPEMAKGFREQAQKLERVVERLHPATYGH